MLLSITPRCSMFMVWIPICSVDHTLWCEQKSFGVNYTYGVNKHIDRRSKFPLVWSDEKWCDHAFVLKLDFIHTILVWSHHFLVWSQNQYGVIRTHVFCYKTCNVQVWMTYVMVQKMCTWVWIPQMDDKMLNRRLGRTPMERGHTR